MRLILFKRMRKCHNYALVDQKTHLKYTTLKNGRQLSGLIRLANFILKET